MHKQLLETRIVSNRFKAWSLNRQEIIEWVNNEIGRPCERCWDCSPDSESPQDVNGQHHLSRLAAKIVDYVLEVATIHLDSESSPYQLTVQDIAACMGKTPAQVAPTLKRLVDDGYLAGDDHFSERRPFRARQAAVYPTANALRMRPYFGDWTDESLQVELEKLRV